MQYSATDSKFLFTAAAHLLPAPSTGLEAGTVQRLAETGGARAALCPRPTVFAKHTL